MSRFLLLFVLELNSEVLLFGGLTLFIFFLVLLMIFRKRSNRLYEEEVQSTRRELILEGTIDSLSREKQVLYDKHTEVQGQVREITRLNDYILKSVDYAIISTDLENHIKSVNPQFFKYFQVSFNDIYGKSIEQFFQHHSELVQRFRTLTQNKTSSSFRMEFTYRKPNLVLQWFDISATRLKDNYNNDIGYVILLRDITKFKNMETQLALKQEMEVLGEMSAIIAHEFRNAMNPIKGNARLLSKKTTDPELQEIIEDIHQAIEQLNELMIHLLNYAKNQPLEFKEIDLREILQQTSMNVSKTLIEKKLFISFRYHGERFITQGDAITLQQAFSNLILNAIDAVPAETGTISVEISTHDPYYQILFSDNGTGIPSELRDKIFRPFFTTKAKGTGLGLAFTHKIIVAHGGTITMNCPESGGTQFLIQFPILPLLVAD